jgi:phosphatidate cytidylyltransferase
MPTSSHLLVTTDSFRSCSTLSASPLAVEYTQLQADQVGFVGFVANLKKQHLRQQFALFCWVHISLFLIVVSSHFIVNSILEGMIWFFVPASLVICNDVMAYVCGKLFGRTPLIKLSPKKTVEGFMGAFLCTLLFSLAVSYPASE